MFSIACKNRIGWMYIYNVTFISNYDKFCLTFGLVKFSLLGQFLNQPYLVLLKRLGSLVWDWSMRVAKPVDLDICIVFKRLWTSLCPGAIRSPIQAGEELLPFSKPSIAEVIGDKLCWGVMWALAFNSICFRNWCRFTSFPTFQRSRNKWGLSANIYSMLVKTKINNRLSRSKHHNL